MAREARARRSSPTASSGRGRRRLSRLRWSPWPRRLLALAFLLAAVVVVQGTSRDDGTPSSTPGTMSAVPVVVAARDIPAGVTLTADDLAVADLPDALVPTGAVHPGDEPVGRVTSGPVRTGETLTDVRTIGPGYLAALPDDTAAVPLRLTDPGVARLIRAGDRVDLYAGPRGSPPRLVAAGAVVLTVGVTDRDAIAVDVGPLLLVAVPISHSAELAGSAVDGVVTATLAPP